ncbi:MAG: hypothetical protein ACHQ4G_01560 [Opitutales bacterium]
MPVPTGLSKKPWPMKWIVVSIAIFVVGYTYLTLHFRKVNRAYEPYHDLKERALTHKLLTAGYQRITVPADLPTEPGPVHATTRVATGPGGLPAALQSSLFDQPKLPESYQRVQAPASANALLPYSILFECEVGDIHHQLGGAEIYVRDGTIVIVPMFEKLDGDLLARRSETLVRLTVPAGELKPGPYQVQLAGSRSSLTWTLQVH